MTSRDIPSPLNSMVFSWSFICDWNSAWLCPFGLTCFGFLFWLESKFGRSVTREVRCGHAEEHRRTFPFLEHILKVGTPKPAAGAWKESISTAEVAWLSCNAARQPDNTEIYSASSLTTSVQSDSTCHPIQNGISAEVNPRQAHYATYNSVRDQNHSSFALLGSTLSECEQPPAREHPLAHPSRTKRQGRGVLHSLGSWAKLRGPGVELEQALTLWCLMPSLAATSWPLSASVSLFQKRSVMPGMLAKPFVKHSWETLSKCSSQPSHSWGLWGNILLWSSFLRGLQLTMADHRFGFQQNATSSDKS